MSVPHWCRSHPALAGLAAACLLSACASVDLGRRYDPPPIRAPQPLPPAQLPSVPSNGVQTQPVTPAQPVPQPLPPTGQSAPPPVAPADPGAHLVTLTTRLDGASVMPPTRSAGSAQLDAVYDPATRLLRWKTRWSGLSGAITGVQFHGPADAGQNAPAVLAWPAPFGASYEGRATLGAAQANDLLAGRWYVSVYTAAYPLGELRGQVRVVP